MRLLLFLIINFLFATLSSVSAWVSSHHCDSNSRNNLHQLTRLSSQCNQDHGDDSNTFSRRSAIRTVMTSFVATSSFMTGVGFQQQVQPANALVKGVAPPPKTKPMSDKPKCTNVEECQAMAEKKQQEEALENRGPPPEQTKGGVKYRDLVVPTDDENALTVKDGDDVTLYYKVLKLGKRSYDGLSGEGTVVFSRGYGLEDDEKKPGEKSFITTVGGANNIIALNEALIGMKVGGTRRFSILPQMGWEKATKQCDGGPGGQGSGGSIKTDYVIVPTATMVSTEDCFNKFKQPFPSTYAEERRMAQRFDQSLIMEVQVIKAGPSSF